MTCGDIVGSEVLKCSYVASSSMQTHRTSKTSTTVVRAMIRLGVGCCADAVCVKKPDTAAVTPVGGCTSLKKQVLAMLNYMPRTISSDPASQ
eukprot:1160793-Pelagomonas_calceolata.AAC.11